MGERPDAHRDREGAASNRARGIADWPKKTRGYSPPRTLEALADEAPLAGVGLLATLGCRRIAGLTRPRRSAELAAERARDHRRDAERIG